MENGQQSEFRVGECWVRPRLREIESAGGTHRVEEGSMGVLCLLAEMAPELVTREEILERVWKDRFVADEVVNHAIWELRRAFGDSARDPAYIETVPRRGYRLIEQVLRPSAGDRDPVPGARIGQYVLGDELGRGSMGVVFKAEDLRLRRPVALKFIARELTRDHEARRRFEREARVAASLDHPNLATVYEISETSDGRLFIAMSYYEGGSLKDRLAEGRLELEEALRLGEGIVCGLDEAHRAGVIHRDIKPANILLNSAGVPKVADFGIAKLMGGTVLTRTGTRLGTPAYKSPEQSREEEVDQRSDLWSLGVVLYEMVYGRRPFGGGYDQAVVHSILSDEPDFEKDAAGEPVPVRVADLIRRAIAKAPAERFGSAEEFREALDSVRGPQVGPGTSEPSWWRKWILSIVVPLVLMTFAASWIVRVVQGGDEAPPGTDRETPPAEVLSLLNQGVINELEGDDKEHLGQAEALFREALKLDRGNALALSHLAIHLAHRFNNRSETKDLEETRLLVAEAFEAPEPPALAYVARSYLHQLEDAYVLAEADARTAIDLDAGCDRDECDRARIALGEALFAQGRVDDALDELQRSTEEGRGYLRGRIVLARKLYQLQRYDEAVSVYGEVLKLDPDNTTALNNTGVIYLLNGRYTAAIHVLDRALREKPSAETRVNVGTCHLSLTVTGQRSSYWRAIEHFEVARSLDESLPTAWTGLGDTYLAMGDLDLARQQYRKALELFDQKMLGEKMTHKRRGQRAVLLAKLGEFREARSEIEALLEVYPDSGRLLSYAARISALAGQGQELCGYLRRARAAGFSSDSILADVSFIPYRDDPEFRAALGID